MPQRTMQVQDVREIVSHVEYEKDFRVDEMGTGFFVQIAYHEPDVRTGEMSPQRGRKWYVSPYATDSEVVQTCLSAALASAEHQVREHFGYRGSCPVCVGTGKLGADDYPYAMPRTCQACGGSGRGKAKLIYGPHFSADALWGICGAANSYDAREDPE